MRPPARLQMAIDIVAGLDGTPQPADRYLKDWFASRRFAGSGDRRAISELVFRILRQRFSLGWRMGDSATRALMIAALLADGQDPETLFTGGYGPEPLRDAERNAIANPPGEAPLWVTGEFPQSLESELTRRFGERLADEMAAFQLRAPADLRVNTLKAARGEVLARLKEDGFEADVIGEQGVRCAPGSTGLNKHALFESGAFEFQDLSAQMAVERAGVKPGMRVLDLAAGAGGKSLALAAAMQNEGEIIACDIRGQALAELEKRAARAGVNIIRTRILGEVPPGPYDLVFVDAPCSGTGTWRRQPELKNRVTAERLERLIKTQDGLLAQGAEVTRPGGRLVYATCSILPCENEDRVSAFLAKNPQFGRAGEDFQASPLATGGDGFYAAFLACK